MKKLSYLEQCRLNRAIHLDADVFLVGLMRAELNEAAYPLLRTWQTRLEILEVEMRLAACILRNPEWEVELGGFMKDEGCPAQTITKKKEFLKLKGVI